MDNKEIYLFNMLSERLELIRLEKNKCLVEIRTYEKKINLSKKTISALHQSIEKLKKTGSNRTIQETISFSVHGLKNEYSSIKESQKKIARLKYDKSVFRDKLILVNQLINDHFPYKNLIKLDQVSFNNLVEKINNPNIPSEKLKEARKRYLASKIE